MKNIAIFGAGGLGSEVYCLIKDINNSIEQEEEKWNFVGFFDDVKEKSFQIGFGEVLGGMQELNTWTSSLALVIAIGSPTVIKNIKSRISNINITFPNLIAPDVKFYDMSTVKIGQGNIIFPRCLISCNINIENFNIINNLSTIGHDVIIGSYNTIMPAVRISGNVSLGDCNLVGVASIILQTLTIGHNTIIGAGSVVIRNTINESTYVGNPARKIEYKKV